MGEKLLGLPVGRKKKFIDKNRAKTFRLVHREDNPEHGLVLEPVMNFNPYKKGVPQATEEQAAELTGEKPQPLPEELHYNAPEAYGFPDDGYDYMKHLKPIGAGKFIPALIPPTIHITGDIEEPEVKSNIENLV